VPFDGLAVAHALAAALKDQGFDLILFGRVSTDTGNGTVGAMTAQLLDLPCVTAISKLEIAGGKGTAQRELEGATETVSFPLPAVLTIDEGIARPAAAVAQGHHGRQEEADREPAAQLGGVQLTVDKLELPPERAAGRIRR
jgi:electron transfer flavoprotein beta subunit